MAEKQAQHADQSKKGGLERDDRGIDRKCRAMNHQLRQEEETQIKKENFFSPSSIPEAKKIVLSPGKVMLAD